MRTLDIELGALCPPISENSQSHGGRMTRALPDQMRAPAVSNVFPLERAILKRIDETRAAWKWIGAAFQDHNPHCNECSFCSVEMEYGGSGNDRGLCVESACRIGRFGEGPMQCPAYAAEIKDAAQAV